MAKTIELDASQFYKSMDNLSGKSPLWAKLALGKMADALLALSRAEVPHDLGTLQSSGHTYPDGDDYAVAYNTKYASYQHEGVRRDGTHQIKHYQKGRKGKFLEDPLKMNISKWGEIFATELSKNMKGNV